MVEDGLAVGDVEDAGLEAHDAAGGDAELEVGLLDAGAHVAHGAADVAEDLDDLAGVVVGALDDGLLDRLDNLAVLVLLEQDARAADLELVALATHLLHEDREVQDATAGDLGAGLVGKLLDAHGHVVLALLHEALLELATTHDVALAADERRGGGLEDDRQGGRVDLDGVELDGVLGVGVDVADVGRVDAHDGRDVAGLRLGALLAAKVVEGEELLDLAHGAAAVVLDDEDLVTGVDGAGVDAADADATDVVGVVDGDALHGEGAVDVHVGGGQGVNNHVHQREHVVVAVLGVEAREAVDRRGVHDVLHGELELRVVRAEVHHEVEAVVEGLLGVGALAVDLVDAGDGVLQDEARLGHGALGRVDEQQGAVGHLEHALDLAAKVGVARGVDHVDLDALVLDGDVLREDRDATLALLVVGVKNPLLDLLVLAEGVGGLQHLVDQRGLAVVDVRDDCDVADVLLEHGNLFMTLRAEALVCLTLNVRTVYQGRAYVRERFGLDWQPTAAIFGTFAKLSL